MFIWLALICLMPHLIKSSIDATVTPSFVYGHHQFSDGDYARGHVFFSQGFSVPAGAEVTIGIAFPIFGDVNLHQTGRLLLEAPLVLGGTPYTTLYGGELTSIVEGRPVEITLLSDAQILSELIISGTGGGVINGLGNVIFFDDRPDLIPEPDYISSNNRGALRIESDQTTTLRFINCKISDLGDLDDSGSLPRLRANEFGSGRHIVECAESQIYLGTNRGSLDYVSPSSVVTCSGFAWRFVGSNNIFSSYDSNMTLSLRGGIIFAPTSQTTFGPGVTLALTGTTHFSQDTHPQFSPWLHEDGSVVILDNCFLNFSKWLELGRTEIKGFVSLSSTATSSYLNKIYARLDQAVFDIQPGAALILDGVYYQEVVPA